jgi:hypothetical protein
VCAREACQVIFRGNLVLNSSLQFSGHLVENNYKFSGVIQTGPKHILDRSKIGARRNLGYRGTKIGSAHRDKESATGLKGAKTSLFGY